MFSPKKIVTLLLLLCLAFVLPLAANGEAESFSASSAGLMGNVTVTLSLDDGVITNVVIDATCETPALGGVAAETMAAAMLAGNTVEVDAISGATVTSEAILKAAADAYALYTGAEVVELPKEAYLPLLQSNLPKNSIAAAVNAPEVTLKNGVQIQLTPDDDRGWNNLYMDADNRGCNACHADLEDLPLQMETYHGIVYYGYQNTMTVAQCLMCHSFYETPLRDTIHAIHLGDETFESMSGSCNSCHYINAEGEYERWDYVKYDHLKGITDIAAEDAKLSITYDQDKLTDTDQMYYKSVKVVDQEPIDWLTDESQIQPDLFENWTITVNGDVDNPFTMTLPEMLNTFELTTETMSSQCCINGTGNGMIFQCEVTGILLKDIFEYAKVHDDVTTFNAACSDTYGTGGNCYPMDWSYVVDNGGILVLYVNGEDLPADQGYPCATWVARTSSGNCYKYVQELTVTKEENPAHWALTGYFVDPSTGKPFAKPNMGVLSTYSGTIFSEGETVHLEGFADAWDEPIEYLEYSLDHGETWTRIDTPDNDSWRWTYWYLDFEAPGTGSYLLRMRAVSRMEDGTLREPDIDTDFLINVK